MKSGFGIMFFLVFSIYGFAQQRTVAECTVEYDITTDSVKYKDAFDALKNGKKVLLIKGIQSRSDFFNGSFLQSTFIKKDTGNIYVYREIGDNKILTVIDRTNWQIMNSAFDSAELINSAERKRVLNFDCKHVILKLKNGDEYSVYYAPTIMPSIKEYEYAFSKIPGLVLEYNIKKNNEPEIKYVAKKINFNPVPSAKMELPKSGYRIYNEYQ